MSRQAIINELRNIYKSTDNPEWNNLWPVTRDWLRKMQNAKRVNKGKRKGKRGK